MNRATCGLWKGILPTRGLSLATLILIGTAIAIIALIMTIDGAPTPVIAQTTSCANTDAIPGTGAAESTALIADCNALLTAAALLTDTTGLNWETTRVISTWQGITVSMARVTGLDLANQNLTGTVPAVLGNLSALTTLHLYSNSLTG